MAGKKRKATAQTSAHSIRSTRSSTKKSDVSQIYRDMLAEADVGSAATSEERPIKRRRPGQRRDSRAQVTKSSPEQNKHMISTDLEELHEENEDELERLGEVGNEDIVLPPATIQTIYRDSEEEEEDDELFEDIDVFAYAAVSAPGQDNTQDLELDLSAHTKPTRAATVNKRKHLSKAEKEHRVEIHKIHLLCLLAHVARRNRWCNDPQVQDSLQRLLTPKMVALLNPKSHVTQFAQALSLKEGLKSVNAMFSSKFRTTERGLRKALWAETEEHLQDYYLPTDSEAPFEKSDFREAAKSLNGSRDVGAQLYCALLRGAGVEARLVCSLQPLSFSSAGPYMTTTPKKKQDTALEEKYGQHMKSGNAANASTSSTSFPSPRRRLGHPNAAAFILPELAPPRQATPAPAKIHESKFPVYWVEILDKGHQKWQPTDPLVTGTYWNHSKLEPSLWDKENSMGYVVTFEEDGTAKDVTRRYAKAYNAKTRKMRVESVLSSGETWWRRALQAYRREHPRDLDEIEASEMTALELREPMPRNIVDFKDHPIYALERHLRQHEVLVPNASPSGTVGAGSTGPLERVYRRKDVRTARSKEKWYRLGREVLPNELPAKVITRPSKLHEDLFSEDAPTLGEGETCGTPIYTMEQTEIYKPPPVQNGKIPKNRYGNIDLFVPGMVPEGGIYITDDYGAQAAVILSVDYARALTGFQFSGKKGTAVLRGVVVAEEYEEAVREVVAGLKDLETEMESVRKRRQVLRMWKLFLINLRVRERIGCGQDEVLESEMGDQGDEVSGGGFEIADEDAGGFEVDDNAGGFMLD